MTGHFAYNSLLQDRANASDGASARLALQANLSRQNRARLPEGSSPA